MKTLKLIPATILLCATSVGTAEAQFFNDFDQPPHDYWTAPMHDPMTELLREVKAGKTELPDETGLPLVKRLLEELDIPVESQVLVFSRTSLQRGVVSPKNPRAIYFNEDTYLGWMPGGRIEIASSDPDRGAIFFFQRKLDQHEGPLFVRDRVCIQCHAGSATNFLPGLLGRSVYPDARGRSMRSVDSFERVGHEIPLQDRWGGWYVTGGHGALRHMGNTLAERGANGIDIDRAANAGLDGLGQYFDTAAFPRGTSDIVPLMVLDHQISMHFELMEAHYVVRQLVEDEQGPDGKIPEKMSEEFAKEIDDAADRLIAYLLFKNEASLGDVEITGDGEYQKIFLRQRKADGKGRALRDFNLKGRLFDHRCSFMIHSASFTALPPVLKEAIFAKLREILGSESPPEAYAYLPRSERQGILEILRETVPSFED